MRHDTIAPGTRIGNVVVSRLIGAGGFGVVYEGRDVVLDRLVAIKLVEGDDLDADETARGRLLGEARALARVRSPHVVALHRAEPFGAHGLALEMEHVGGGSLAQALGPVDRLATDAPAPLAVGRVVAVAREIASALRAAHREQVVHGDLKPENVLLTTEGTAKLVDFGLAHILGEHRLESTGSAGGSPSYMAPEVITGAGVGRESDVWSLGVLVHRMLTGRLPFVATSLPALFFAILEDPPPPMAPDTPVALARLVERCLSKSPADRPASSELPELLEHVLDGRTQARPGGPVDLGPDVRPLQQAVPRPVVFGRDGEWAIAEAALDDVVVGRGRTVLVTGDVGIGKTTLVRRAAWEASARGLGWIEVSLARSVGLLRPLLVALRRSLPTGDDAGTTGVAVDSATFGPAVNALRTLLRDERRPEVESRDAAAFAIESLLVALARRRPIVLAVEGVHGAERDEIGLLRDLARRLREHRVLLLLTARVGPSGEGPGSGSLAPFAELDDVVRIPLAPFDRETLYGVLETVAGVPIAPDVARALIDRSSGNPLLALELLRHARATGVVVESSLGLRAAGAASVSSLPVRLVDLFAARVDALPRPERELLEVAAVDGTTFDGEALAAALGRPLLTVLRQLQRIARETGILLPRAAGFHFSHSLLRDVLYDGVAPALRRELHAALARHLEARTGDVDPERIGVHFEGAGEAVRAIPYLRRALRDALFRHETERSVALLPRARLRLEDLDDDAVREHGDTLLRIARVYSTRGGHDDVVEAMYAIVTDPARSGGDPTLPLRAEVRRAHHRFFAQGAAAVDEAAMRRAAVELPPSEDQARAHYLLGLIAKFRGDLAEARTRLEQSLEIFEATTRSLAHRATAIDQLASIERREGRPALAATRYGEAAELATRAGIRHNAAASHVNRVIATLAAGECDGQAEILDRAIRATELAGSGVLTAHALVVRARLLYATGDTDRAIACVEGVLARQEVSTYLPAAIAARLELGQLALVVGDAARSAEQLAAAETAAAAQRSEGSLLIVAALACQRACLESTGGPSPDVRARFLERLARMREPQGRVDGAALAIEATLFGPPSTFALEVAEELVRSGLAGEFEPARSVVTRAEAFAAFRSGEGDPQRLEQAGTELVRGPRPERPATLAVIAEVLLAEAARRRGSAQDAKVGFERARGAAQALRHALLVRTCDERLSRLRTPRP